jgi:uncharacterized membrane protein
MTTIGPDPYAHRVPNHGPGRSHEIPRFRARSGRVRLFVILAGMEAVLLALGIGFVSGLRTMTSLAALALTRGGVWAVVLAIAALGEYVADLLPGIPSRTALPSIVLRPLSGAIAGWLICAGHGGPPLAGAVAGIAGALAGTYGGHAARLWAIARIGAIPAGLAEDLVAIALAAFFVTR